MLGPCTFPQESACPETKMPALRVTGKESFLEGGEIMHAAWQRWKDAACNPTDSYESRRKLAGSQASDTRCTPSSSSFLLHFSLILHEHPGCCRKLENDGKTQARHVLLRLWVD